MLNEGWVEVMDKVGYQTTGYSGRWQNPFSGKRDTQINMIDLLANFF
jgi:hypothetical protein